MTSTEHTTPAPEATSTEPTIEVIWIQHYVGARPTRKGIG